MFVTNTFKTRGHGKTSPHEQDRRFSDDFEKGGGRFDLTYLYGKMQGHGVEDADTVTAELGILMKQVDLVVTAIDPHTNEPYGFLIAGGNQIFLIYTIDHIRRHGIATSMIEAYKTAVNDLYPQLQAVWQGSRYDIVKMFDKCGFSTVSYYDVAAEGCCRNEAHTPRDVEFEKRAVEGYDGYVEFRGDYAVVDGHYTLEQLENILVVARKELTK